VSALAASPSIGEHGLRNLVRTPLHGPEEATPPHHRGEIDHGHTFALKPVSNLTKARREFVPDLHPRHLRRHRDGSTWSAHLTVEQLNPGRCRSRVHNQDQDSAMEVHPFLPIFGVGGRP
jgi:hypothetical protein